MNRKRQLMPSRIELGVPVAGRCSVCHRPFEIEPNDKDSPASIQQELRALFDNHTCDEDFSQAAFRAVQEATDKV